MKKHAKKTKDTTTAERKVAPATKDIVRPALLQTVNRVREGVKLAELAAVGQRGS